MGDDLGFQFNGHKKRQGMKLCGGLRTICVTPLFPLLVTAWPFACLAFCSTDQGKRETARSLIERCSLDCRKTKTKVNTPANQRA